MKRFLSLIIICLFCTYAYAQEKVNESQISFIYPFSSEGTNSVKYANKFSFNLIMGINGGLQGTEIGGVLNLQKGEVKGKQFSCVANIDEKKASGLLIAGAANIVNDTVEGVMISSSGNICRYTNGINVTGGLNIIEGDCDGVQAGSINIVKNMRGNQYGAINIVSKQCKGSQIGAINISNDSLKGTQIGAINIASKTKGVQIGLINIAHKSENHTPIGILNIIKNGYYAMEISSDEIIYSNLSYKMGVHKFYSIIRVGYSSYKSKPVFCSGAGFGSIINLSEKHKISLDLVVDQLRFNNKWDDKVNILNRFIVNYKCPINKTVSLFIGPTFNVYVSKVKYDGKLGTINIPYKIYEYKSDNILVSSWIGGNIGFEIKL